MTSKFDPPTERIKQIIMAADPYHRYSNEAKRANQDIYYDFKLKKKPTLVSMVYTKILYEGLIRRETTGQWCTIT